jgi:hypothetical protein
LPASPVKTRCKAGGPPPTGLFPKLAGGGENHSSKRISRLPDDFLGAC